MPVVRLLLPQLVLPVVYAAMGAMLAPSTPWAVVNVLLWPFILAGSVVLHEFGHAAVAHAVGCTVPSMTIGLGPRVKKLRWGGTLFVLNSFPVLGLTVVGTGADRWLRLRFWLTVTGGPLMTWALFAATSRSFFAAVFPGIAMVEGPAILPMMASANLLLLVGNLMPLRLAHAGIGSDGYQLLTLPFARQSFLDTLRAMAQLGDVADDIEEGRGEQALAKVRSARARFPDCWQVQSYEAICLSYVFRHEEALALNRTLMGVPEAARQYGWLLANNIAWESFCVRREELKEEADALSLRALKEGRGNPVTFGTRGAVLTWRGEHAEGLALTERAFALNSAPRIRALNACVAALACVGLQRTADAQTWLERARAFDATCEFLPEAEQAVGSLTSAAPP